ncbi:MAG: 1,4-dihydroxy-2-naphthoate octaprenyltransferase [Flavobacteriaceae bacterium]
MNSQFSIWLAAARLRTLPLSLAGIITGNAIAFKDESFSKGIFILSLLTAIAFQIISNFANDYGDGIRGTDNANRLGPQRTFQKGLLTGKALKRGIWISSFISIIFSISLIYLALGDKQLLVSFFFLALATAAVWAAIKYTVGNGAYGYIGLGDLFVFLFFGWVSVMGSHYLQIQTIDRTVLFLGTAIGLFSVGVLNLNNMRDIVNDKDSQKKTLVVYLGGQKAKYYHYLLIVLGGLFLFFGIGETRVKENPFFLLIIIPILFHLYKVLKIRDPRAYDHLLKQLALTTFIVSLALFALFFCC